MGTLVVVLLHPLLSLFTYICKQCVFSLILICELRYVDTKYEEF